MAVLKKMHAWLVSLELLNCLQFHKVWTSTLKRTIETAATIDAPQKEQWSALDELDAVRQFRSVFNQILGQNYKS